MVAGLQAMASRPLAPGRVMVPTKALCFRPARLGAQAPMPFIIRSTSHVTRRPRIAICRADAAVGENPFTQPRPVQGLPATLFGLPVAGVYALGAALAAALGFGGWSLAARLLPESLRSVGRLVAAAIGAALAAAVTSRLLTLRRSAAVAQLHNLLVSLPRASDLTRDQVAALEAQAGAPLAAIDPEAVKSLYGTFIEATIPAGDAPLRGDEHTRISAFKQTLGLDDEAAGPVHVDVGRRILRGRLEAGSRREDVEARKAFQKLIYVSYLVFAERSYLTPWARAFGLTDAQVYVARRDNARALFQAALAARGGVLVPTQEALTSLREVKESVRLADEEAEGVVREAARATLQGFFDRALSVVKRRARQRDLAEAVAELRGAVEFNRALARLAGAPGVVPGVGPTSVAGSEWAAAEGRGRDLRDLFRTFVEEGLARDGAYGAAETRDAADLRSALGLGPKEAAGVEEEVKERVYRRRLREEVTSGRLDAAPSPAAVLGDLVERVGFDPSAAAALHAGLYRQKLAALLEKRALSDADAGELDRLQRLLCVPAADRDALHAELAGGIYSQTLDKALAAGAEGFGLRERGAVRDARRDLRLDPSIARRLLAAAGRRHLLQFITNARKTKSRVDGAKELKRMVLFSSVVLAPLVDDLRSPEERTAAREAEERERRVQEMVAKMQRDKAEEARRQAAAAGGEKKAEEGVVDVEAAEVKTPGDEPEKAAEAGKEEAAAAEKAEPVAAEATESTADGAPSSLKKAQAAADSRKAGEKVGDQIVYAQKDITLADDLDLRDRLDVYRNFLLYCMTGDVSSGPMGVTMVIERDESEFARLAQLGDVLGLTQVEVATVHSDLAEQAFKSQVQQVMGEGALTPDRLAGLEAVRQRMGLPKETADKVLKGFQNQKLIAGMQAAKAQGQLTLPFLLELKEAGVDVASLTSADLRLQLYRQEAIARLTDGTGEFATDRIVEELPAALGIEVGKARKLVQELARDRRRTTLVQAVSFLRQKKYDDTVKALNNLLAVEKAAPSDAPLSWSPAEELADLYSLYVSKESAEEKRAGVQACLGLADGDAAGLRAVVEAGNFKLGQETESEAAFF
ncbi:hypothetical protein ACKKBG_A24285 [Auxenochlorella protothecoides x Auxenochlorella symbiontica]